MTTTQSAVEANQTRGNTRPAGSYGLPGFEFMDWWIYVLECCAGRYYIGIARDVDKRVREHFAGKGASFTRRYPPLKLVEKVCCDTPDKELAKAQEDGMTVKYADRYGYGLVRGGRYFQERKLRFAVERSGGPRS